MVACYVPVESRERLLALLRCACGIVHQPLLADFHYRSCKKGIVGIYSGGGNSGSPLCSLAHGFQKPGWSSVWIVLGKCFVSPHYSGMVVLPGLHELCDICRYLWVWVRADSYGLRGGGCCIGALWFGELAASFQTAKRRLQRIPYPGRPGACSLYFARHMGRCFIRKCVCRCPCGFYSYGLADCLLSLSLCNHRPLAPRRFNLAFSR